MTQETLTDVQPEADEWWRDGAARAVEALAASGRPFLLSEIRDDPYSVPEPDHPSQWGALAMSLSAAGVIRRVGYAPSNAPSRHRAIVSVWQGCPRRSKGR